MRRGEVWWADLPPPIGRRPVVLVSRDEAYTVRSLVMIAEVTTRPRGIPAEVALGQTEGVPRPSVANLDSIATVPKIGLRRYLGVLSPAKMRELDAALRFAFGIDT